MRRRRLWRWVGLGVVLFFAGFFVLDVVVVQYLESRGAAELARSTSAEDSQIELGGFPFIPRFMGGKLTDVNVKVRGATASGGLRVASVEARMESITFDAGDIFTVARSIFSTRTEVTATNPILLLELAQSDLNDYIRRVAPSVGDVRVEASGVEVRFLKDDVDETETVHPTEDNMTKPARYVPAIRDRKFELILTSLSQVPAGLRAEAQRLEDIVKLPTFPEGMNSDVNLRNGVIGIEAQGAEVTESVGQGT
jgi:hypothetical protein